MKIPFAAVATDLNWGYKVVLDRGSVARAIRASAAIPGVFQPVQHQGKILVDGGVVDNIPISVAKAKGADIVIAVDISANIGNTNITNLVGVTLQATNIMFALNVEQSKKGADILITPMGIGDIGMLDFTQKKRCMQAGIQATQAAIPNIRKAINVWVAAHTPSGTPTP
jgi:NTE family protein